MESVLSKFLRYVSVETTSDENSQTHPSSACQLHLLKMLNNELKELGYITEYNMNGYVTSTIPSNITKSIPTVAFLAHVDTSPDALGNNIKPIITENYNGCDIVLNKEKNILLQPKIFPDLLAYKGQTIISSDGTTLLGADDKAGVAAIMYVAEYLFEHKDVPHGEIKIAFTSDEEIGCGVDLFDVNAFGADYAYTVDGGAIGELEYENFNASAAVVKISGLNVHPGYAKNTMINSQYIAAEFLQKIPINERPETTEGREGFIHVTDMQGDVSSTEIHFIIRDFCKETFIEKQNQIKLLAEELQKKYNVNIQVEIKLQYENMLEKIQPCMFVVDIAKQAMIDAGITPKIQPIRGGTDGARLSYMGLPCPNLFAGGHNFHSVYEFVPLESIEKATEVIINISKKFVEL